MYKKVVHECKKYLGQPLKKVTIHPYNVQTAWMPGLFPTTHRCVLFPITHRCVCSPHYSQMCVLSPLLIDVCALPITHRCVCSPHYSQMCVLSPLLTDVCALPITHRCVCVLSPLLTYVCDLPITHRCVWSPITHRFVCSPHYSDVCALPITHICVWSPHYSHMCVLFPITHRCVWSLHYSHMCVLSTLLSRAGVLVLSIRTHSTRVLNFLYSYCTRTREFQSHSTRTRGQVLRYSYEYWHKYWYSKVHLRYKGENHHTFEINSITYHKGKVPNWFNLL